MVRFLLTALNATTPRIALRWPFSHPTFARRVGLTTLVAPACLYTPSIHLV